MGSPLYEGLAADLRQQVLTGKYSPGERIPSESELGQTHQVSRTTVRQALGRLVQEGILIPGKGRGYFVRERDPIRWHLSRPERNTRTDIHPADAWSQDVREQGREPTEKRRAVSTLEAEPAIASRLGLEPGALVTVRRRLRFVDGELYAAYDTFFEHELVKDTPIAHPADVLPGTYAVMEELGLGWNDKPRDEVIARHARTDEAELFGLQPGDPVAEVFRTRLTDSHRPVAVTVTVAPGDRVIIVID